MPRVITSVLILPGLILPAVLVLMLLPVTAFAQGETTSAIVGQVSDASGAAVPGATVTIHNTDTGLRRIATTDESGRFNFTQLQPGTYTVRVEAQGFDPKQNDGVSASLGQKQTADFVVQVAQAKENIEVSGEAVILNPGKCEYSNDPQRARTRKPSESGRRFDLSTAICHRGAYQHGGQRK